jgi:hypothetical protein
VSTYQNTLTFPRAGVQVNILGVFSLFEQAIANRLKYPKIRLQTRTGAPVVLSRAGDKSKYTGQVMITDGRPYGANVYYGRVGMDGVFYRSGVDSPGVVELLERLACNPAEVAGEYGRLNRPMLLLRASADRCAEHCGGLWAGMRGKVWSVLGLRSSQLGRWLCSAGSIAGLGF